MNGFDSIIAKTRGGIADSRALQYLLPLVLLLLVCYVLEFLWRANGEMRSDYDQLRKQEAQISNLEQQADWNQLEHQARVASDRIDTDLWRAESLELAAADIQSILRKLIKDRIKAARIQMAEPVWVAEAESWQISAEITGKLVGDEVQQLMLDLSRQQPALIVERLSYAPVRDYFGTLHLSSLVIIGDKAAEPSEPSSETPAGQRG